jgi:hypothetical protein
MTRHNGRRLAGAGLILAAIGIPVQIAGGADYPAVPPGLIILAVAGLLMLFAPWRWAMILAAVATVFVSIGAVAAPNLRDQLADPGAATLFLGSLIQLAGLVLALAGLVLMVGRSRKRTPVGGRAQG